jgi:hypothetical protein
MNFLELKFNLQKSGSSFWKFNPAAKLMKSLCSKDPTPPAPLLSIYNAKFTEQLKKAIKSRFLELLPDILFAYLKCNAYIHF